MKTKTIFFLFAVLLCTATCNNNDDDNENLPPEAPTSSCDGNASDIDCQYIFEITSYTGGSRAVFIDRPAQKIIYLETKEDIKAVIYDMPTNTTEAKSIPGIFTVFNHLYLNTKTDDYELAVPNEHDLMIYDLSDLTLKENLDTPLEGVVASSYIDDNKIIIGVHGGDHDLIVTERNSQEELATIDGPHCPIVYPVDQSSSPTLLAFPQASTSSYSRRYQFSEAGNLMGEDLILDGGIVGREILYSDQHQLFIDQSGNELKLVNYNNADDLTAGSTILATDYGNGNYVAIDDFALSHDQAFLYVSTNESVDSDTEIFALLKFQLPELTFVEKTILPHAALKIDDHEDSMILVYSKYNDEIDGYSYYYSFLD